MFCIICTVVIYEFMEKYYSRIIFILLEILVNKCVNKACVFSKYTTVHNFKVSHCTLYIYIIKINTFIQQGCITLINGYSIDCYIDTSVLNAVLNFRTFDSLKNPEKHQYLHKILKSVFSTDKNRKGS